MNYNYQTDKNIGFEGTKQATDLLSSLLYETEVPGILPIQSDETISSFEIGKFLSFETFEAIAISESAIS